MKSLTAPDLQSRYVAVSLTTDTNTHRNPVAHAARVNDPELPLYTTVSSAYLVSELASILMAENINLQPVYCIQLLGVTKAATFMVDLDDVLASRQTLEC